MSREGAERILIVDNDPAVVTALTARLGGMGYRCATASCGSQAMAQFLSTTPNLVISDLNMPNGDGATLAESIRKVSSVPILLISGFKDAYRKQLRHVPDVLFLHKPFSTEALIELVEAALVTQGTTENDVGNAA